MQILIYLALAVPLTAAIISYFHIRPKMLRAVNLPGSIMLAGIMIAIIYQVTVDGAFRSGMFYVDELSALLLLVIAILSFTGMLTSFSYMEKEVSAGHLPLKRLPQYYTLLNIFIFTMVGLLVLENLGLMWVAVEATTLASALLVAFHWNKTAIEAAWKYVMVCSVGICFALLGTILLYYTQLNAIGMTEALSWLQLKDLGNRLDPAMLKLAFIFILIGYGTKAGLAPMHTWLPDAHSQAPSPVSGLLSGALLSCAMYVVIRNLVIMQNAMGISFGHTLLIGFGLLSIAVAIPFILIQHDLKRLLAYSSVEHMGLIALGLGIGTPLAVYGALLHILNHAVTKSALFYLSGVIIQQYHSKNIARIRGLLNGMPLAGAMFTLFLLAIVGMPPFSIFTSKLTIVWASFGAGRYVLGVVIMFLVAGIFAGMMFYCINMVTGKPVRLFRQQAAVSSAIVAVSLSLAIVIGTGIYLPAWLNGILVRAAAIVAGG